MSSAESPRGSRYDFEDKGAGWLVFASIMLGLGETDAELKQTFSDLHGVGVDVLTLGQYLQPSPYHLKVERFVTPQQFADYKAVAESFGFLYVASGPLVRSSYRAAEFFMKGLMERGRRS